MKNNDNERVVDRWQNGRVLIQLPLVYNSWGKSFVTAGNYVIYIDNYPVVSFLTRYIFVNTSNKRHFIFRHIKIFRRVVISLKSQDDGNIGLGHLIKRTDKLICSLYILDEWTPLNYIFNEEINNNDKQLLLICVRSLK